MIVIKKNCFLVLFTLFSIVSSPSSVLAQDLKTMYENARDDFENENYKAAIKSIDKVLAIDSSDAWYFQLKANCHLKLEEYEEAFLAYSRGINNFPEESMLYNERGVFLTSMQEYTYAKQDLNLAVKHSKNDTALMQSYVNRSIAHSRVRNFEEAYNDLHAAYLLDSTDIAVLVNLGAICDEIGKGDETLVYLLKALEVDSSFFAIYGNIGFKYQEMGEYTKAIEYFDKVLTIDPDQALGYSNRAFCRYKLGDLKGAMKDINKSIKMYPANSYAFRIRGLIYLEKGEKDKACADFDEAITKGFTTSYGMEVINLQMEHCSK